MTDPEARARDDDEDDDWWSEVWDGPVRVTGLQSHTAHLRPCLLTAAGLLLPAAVVGGLVAGVAGAIAAPAAVAVVALFFTLSTLAVAAADRRDPKLTLPVALTTYGLKVWLFGVVAFAVVRGHERWHDVFAAALGVGLVGWLGTHVAWFRRTPPPRVESTGDGAPRTGSGDGADSGPDSRPNGGPNGGDEAPSPAATGATRG